MASRRAARRPTSGSSSSATPCSAWSSPGTPTSATPTSPRASWPRSARPWSTPACWPRWPAGWGSATCSCSAGARRARAAAPRPPSWPTPSRPSSGRSTSTPAGRPPSSWCCASWATPSRGPARSPTTSTTRAGCRRRRCATATARRATSWSDRARTTTGPTWPRCTWAGRCRGAGEGRSKKDAEQEAARAAWEELTGA